MDEVNTRVVTALKKPCILLLDILTWSLLVHALQFCSIINSQKHAALYGSEPLHRSVYRQLRVSFQIHSPLLTNQRNGSILTGNFKMIFKC